jgi:hypothetical protein
MSRHYQSLKSAMDSFRGAQGERLKQLSLQVFSSELFATPTVHSLLVVSYRAEERREGKSPNIKVAGTKRTQYHTNG